MTTYDIKDLAGAAGFERGRPVAASPARRPQITRYSRRPAVDAELLTSGKPAGPYRDDPVSRCYEKRIE